MCVFEIMLKLLDLGPKDGRGELDDDLAGL